MPTSEHISVLLCDLHETPELERSTRVELTRTALATQDAAAPRASTLYGCLMARLDRDSTAREVARPAATIGRVFDRTLLEAVGTLESAALDWGLERLVQEDVVVAVGPGRYAFGHSLLQESRAQLAAKARAAHAQPADRAGAAWPVPPCGRRRARACRTPLRVRRPAGSRCSAPRPPRRTSAATTMTC